MEITNITLLIHSASYDRFKYVGTLRNEKIFNLEDRVFFLFNWNMLSYGTIIGVELSDSDNPERIYKVKLHESTCEYRTIKDGGFIQQCYSILNCSEIFTSIEEAKQSALKAYELDAKIRLNNIENYFKQFEK